MKKIISIVMIVLWFLLVGVLILPLIPNLEPITQLLASFRPYLLVVLILITLAGICWMVFAKYNSEVSDNERFIKYNTSRKIPTRKERQQIFADLQLAEFTLNGEEKPSNGTTEELYRQRLLRDSLVVTTLTPKQEKKMKKEQLRADIKAAKKKEKQIYLINKLERRNLIKVKNRKSGWWIWLLLLISFAVYSYGLYKLTESATNVDPNMSQLEAYIVLAASCLPILVFLVMLIVLIVKRKNILPSIAIPFLIRLVTERVEVWYFNLFDVSFDNLHYILYNVGLVLTAVMLIVFTAHYSKSKYLYLTESENQERLTTVNETIEKNEQEEKIEEAAEKIEQEKLAKELAEKEALEKAEQERLAKELAEKEAAEKAEQEKLAKELAEKEAAEKAEQERLAREKAEIEKQEALKLELEKLAKEEAARKLAAEEEQKQKTNLIKVSPIKTTNVTLWEGLELQVGSGWGPYIGKEEKKQYYKDMMNFVKSKYETGNVYPAKEDLFKCFEYTDFINTKVVIIGKLPFYRKDQADGLAYSTKVGSSMNQTTKVIIQEAVNDVGIKNISTGSFVNWAKRGVLLLNSIMTAPADKPASHAECGWVEFTDGIIELLNKDSKPKVFILWGEYAREKISLINDPNHMILEAPNPSPLSAANGFYGSKPFSKTNEFLIRNGYEPIDWEL